MHTMMMNGETFMDTAQQTPIAAKTNEFGRQEYT